MKLRLSTRIDLPPAEVWQLVQTPRLLDFVAAPLMRFEYLEPLRPRRFEAGGRCLARLRIFGIVPFGTQWIVTSLDEPAEGAWPRRLRDDGHGALIAMWDHWITVAPDIGGGTRYTDELEVRAGALTPFVWAFAQVFYRHRQRRWRKLARLAGAGDRSASSVIGLDLAEATE
jgi:hypothetical protein